VELQETVLVSEGEGEGMAVHRFASEELVIQDAVDIHYPVNEMTCNSKIR
jgi:hypothetical protein